jgi:hypothetical protein
VAKYEDPNFDEKDEKQASEVVDLMQKVEYLVKIEKEAVKCSCDC